MIPCVPSQHGPQLHKDARVLTLTGRGSYWSKVVRSLRGVVEEHDGQGEEALALLVCDS